MEKIELIDKMLKLNSNRKKSVQGLNARGRKKDIKNDSVTISSKAVLLGESKESKKSPEIRTDLVEKYKKDINNGTYKIKTEEIVEKMIAKLKEETYYKRLS